MTSISGALSILTIQPGSPKAPIRDFECWNSVNLWPVSYHSRRACVRSRWAFSIRAESSKNGNAEGGVHVEVEKNGSGFLERRVGSLRQMVDALPPAVLVVRRNVGSNFAIAVCITFACLVIVARRIMVKKQRHDYQGSVADLVRRGQLKSDRRGITKPLKYDDPFNNPFVKIDKGNTSIQMFGKVYRLAPITLTEEQQSIHQKRRSRAYEWKRPTIFLKEGDSIPPNVDPDTVRWIPANHPFAATTNDIDEDIAKNNVYQKDGVPFRVKAEHDALQKKLQALQRDPNSDKVVVNLERPFRSSEKLREQPETTSTSANRQNEHIILKTDGDPDPSDNRSES
ncbi:protein MULTIPLE CHLOROPLAST DIVISION SITE 1 [Typha angustifolia]|uniref:protein MULTIPLE CHLOROPLAST DIVISION SITE 1 n=1 Tax=Typha angustifolia TaxID=59011 RepID=UPI003C2ED293